MFMDRSTGKEGSECLLLVGMFVLLIGTDQTVNSR